jgi:hypothetical protein
MYSLTDDMAAFLGRVFVGETEDRRRRTQHASTETAL